MASKTEESRSLCLASHHGWISSVCHHNRLCKSGSRHRAQILKLAGHFLTEHRPSSQVIHTSWLRTWAICQRRNQKHGNQRLLSSQTWNCLTLVPCRVGRTSLTTELALCPMGYHECLIVKLVPGGYGGTSTTAVTMQDEDKCDTQSKSRSKGRDKLSQTSVHNSHQSLPNKWGGHPKFYSTFLLHRNRREETDLYL